MDSITLCAAIMNLDKVGTYEQTVTLVDTLWKFGSPFTHTSDKDWRAEVELVETLITKKMTKKRRDIFRREKLFGKTDILP